MPKKELAAVLIKEQHNVATNGREYPLRLPRIIHEYVVLWEKRRTNRSGAGEELAPGWGSIVGSRAVGWV